MQRLYRMKDLFFFFSRIPETTCEKYTFSKVIFIKGIADFFIHAKLIILIKGLL